MKASLTRIGIEVMNTNQSTSSTFLARVHHSPFPLHNSQIPDFSRFRRQWQVIELAPDRINHLQGSQVADRPTILKMFDIGEFI